MRRTGVVIATLLTLSVCTGYADVGDVLLGISPVLKLGLSVVALGTSIESAPTDPTTLLYGVPAALLLGVPSGMELWSAISNDPKGVRFWRTVSLFTDAGSTVAVLGFGALALAGSASGGGGEFQDVVGLLAVVAAIPLGVMSLVDLIPFPMEAKAGP